MPSSRVGLRFFNQITRSSQTSFRNNTTILRNHLTKRYATADAQQAATAETAAPESYLKRMWNSEVGIKTVHFWAPVMKWAIVLAGVENMFRPASSLSLTQNVSLLATGAIWTRWCFVIKPRNILLAAVNFALACVAFVQVGRILWWQRTHTGSTEGAIKELGAEAKETVKSVEGEVKKTKDTL